jgi:hypothetical protein
MTAIVVMQLWESHAVGYPMVADEPRGAQRAVNTST